MGDDARYEDRDGKLVYTGSWTRGAAPDTRTVTRTQQVGARGSVSFRGSYVGMHGTVPAGAGQRVCVDFQLDTNPAVPVCHDCAETYGYEVQWWNTDTGPGPHTFSWTYRGGGQPFEVDYVVIDEHEPGEPDGAPASSSSTTRPPAPPTETGESSETSEAAGAPTGDPTSAGSTASDAPAHSVSAYSYTTTGPDGREMVVTASTYVRPSAPSSSSTSDAASGSTDGSSASGSGITVGALVGAVIGGLGLAALILLCVLLLRRSRQRRQDDAPEKAYVGHAPGAATPFDAYGMSNLHGGGPPSTAPTAAYGSVDYSQGTSPYASVDALVRRKGDGSVGRPSREAVRTEDQADRPPPAYSPNTA